MSTGGAPPVIEDLDEGAVRGLFPVVEDLRHDLGKYIGFEASFLPPEPSPEALREALRADLLATRRGPRGVESAADIWTRLRPPLLMGDPDVVAIEQAMGALFAPALDGDESALRQLRDQAREVRRLCQSLSRRLRARAIQLGLDPLDL